MPYAKTKARQRKTPWDPRPCKLPVCNPQQGSAEQRSHERLNGGIYLRGLYVFDPRFCTSEELRHFFWAGLQLLDTEVKTLGLTGEEVRRLVLTSFDTFHDAANGLWETVRKMMSEGGNRPPMTGRVEACCHIISPGRCTESGHTVYPPMPPAAEPIAPDVVTKTSDDAGRDRPVTTAAPAAINPAIAGLRRAFARQAEQVRSYREERDRDLDAILED